MKYLFGNIFNRTLLSLVLLSFLLSFQVKAQTADFLGLDTVKAGKFDNGKMWTFEYPPMDYFSQAYNFQPDEKWFEHIRM